MAATNVIDPNVPRELTYEPEEGADLGDDPNEDPETVLERELDDEGEDSPTGMTAASDAEPGEAEPSTDGPVLGDPPPELSIDGETSVQCPQCETKAGWRGELDVATSQVFTRGVDALTGMPNCPHCGTAMLRMGPTTAVEALQQVAQALDTERAGNAARPLYQQQTLPGTLPPFDFRRALMTAESLEANVQAAEEAWESAKKVAASRKGDYDEAVEALRQHIKEMHTLRINTEYQHGRGERTSVAETTGVLGPCVFERQTGQPCSICRSAIAAPAPNRDEATHLAASLANQAITAGVCAVPAGAADAFVVTVRQVADIELTAEQVRGWTPEDRRIVAVWLQQFAQDAASNEEPWARPIPLALGKFHEAAEASGERQCCRICGAVLLDAATLSITAPWEVGQKVGTDCTGEPIAEPARTAKPRHASRKDAAKAKQAAAAADTQVLEQGSTDEAQPKQTEATPRRARKSAPAKKGRGKK